MIKRKKLWISVSTATVVSASLLSGCSTETEEEINVPLVEEEVHSVHMDHVQGEGEGEGEGEGVSSDVDLASDDLAYLTHLGLVRGHLYVGKELYKAGHLNHAKTHMKHPESELYADIEPALIARGGPGFATELQALAISVEEEQGDQAVTAAWDAVAAAIAQNEMLVAESSNEVAAKLGLVTELLRVAGEEYAIAVVDGKMENAHEYQDALGFTHVAETVLADVSAKTPEEEMALSKTKEILSGLKVMWPSLIPPSTLETKASQLYGAAAEVELLAFGL